MNPRPVLYKKDFSVRYAQGEFGNHSPTWNTLEEFLDDPHMISIITRLDGLVHLRNRITWGPTYYNIRPSVAIDWWRKMPDPHNWYCSEMAPTEKTLLQGEVLRGVWGLELYYTTVKKPMREALLERSQSVRGIMASLLLQQVMCPSSYEWLQYLLESYVDHVVEFSVYDCEWGTVPGHNAVFWEVRGGY